MSDCFGAGEPSAARPVGTAELNSCSGNSLIIDGFRALVRFALFFLLDDSCYCNNLSIPVSLVAGFGFVAVSRGFLALIGLVSALLHS